MAWLRLDDGFTKHPKFEGWKPAQRWAWLEVMEYCARYRTRGRIPTDETLLPRSTTSALLAKAEASGWCERRPDSGSPPGSPEPLWIVDFDDYNPPDVDADELYARVKQAVEEHPDASANELARAVGGRRKAALEAIRRFRNGSAPVPQGGSRNHPGTGYARASRPVPSLGTTPAAAPTTHDAANGAAAADHPDIYDRLEALGIATHALPPLASIDLIGAWLDIAETEARDNPAGFVIAGVRSGVWPSPRVRAQDQAPAVDQPARRERFVRGDGWRLPPDELEFQLGELGAADDELVELLELAADLRSGAAA